MLTNKDELKAELEALEQEELDDRLRGADRVPMHTPASPVGQTNGPSRMSLLYHSWRSKEEGRSHELIG